MTTVRNIYGNVAIQGVDDEWPGPDVTARNAWDVSWTGLEYLDPPLSMNPVVFKWGGECRVEVNLDATVITDSGTAELRGAARLYEGDSEDTSDLEEEEPIVLTLLKGRPTQHTVQLESQGIGGGDRATINMTFTNMQDESDE
ncbi:hypothetical protein [Streptomyces sp. 2231.1]|uniref:hypothetical protein n=1 Tax=Streptomyces sp. 2231.1 TaxID=1855347 RepID=UPI00115F8217|nr:hypothetical protein [Streptomyces sp. 2231.1]